MISERAFRRPSLPRPPPPEPAFRRLGGFHLLGSLIQVRRDRLGFVVKATRESGDLVEFRMGRRRLFLLNHPEAARAVLREPASKYAKGVGLAEARPLLGGGLLTGEGDPWHDGRQRLHDLLQPHRMERYAGAIVASTVAWLEGWPGRSPGEAFDATDEMSELTLEILGRTLLRGDLRGHAGLAADFDLVERWALRRMASLWPAPVSWPTWGNLRLRRALARIDRTVAALISAHRAESRAGDEDALDLLLAGSPPPAADQMRDDVMSLLLAGHETSAAALAWTWYLLARHPPAARHLRAELDRELGDRPAGLADLPRLPYTRAVLQEALRLYPPVWMLPRRAKADGLLFGRPIPAGSDVLVCPYTLHRHPDHWERPEEFRPERFLPGAPPPVPGAYLPFGQGPRACLGSAFALMELTLVVATVARRYELDLAPGCDPRPEPLLTLKARNLRLIPRLRPAAP